MVFVREPVLHPVPISSLRPTQMTVGMREVEAKRTPMARAQGNKKAEFLGRHMIPAVLGPKERPYIIDHHHLARALHDEKANDVLVTVVADLRSLGRDEFWVVLDHHSWAHPYDASGSADGRSTISRSRSPTSKTIRFAVSPENCGAPALSPRTRRRSASSCGPISCAGA